MQLQKVTIFFTQLFQTLFSFVKIIILSKWFVGFKKHKPVESECVILGNGPSLKDDLKKHIKFIKAQKKICVNLFAFSKEYEKVRPDYYVLAAPEFWLNETTDFHKEQRSKLVKEISSRTIWIMKLFMPFAAKNSELLNTVQTNKNIEIIFFNPTPVEGFKTVINILFRLNLGMPRPHNVLVPSLYLAINLGFTKIILFGADHSWHEGIKIDESNAVTVNHEHFYDKKEVRMPMYKLDGQQYFLHDIFRKFHLAFKGYFVLKSYADFMGAKILNASLRSYIDAFEKIKLN